MRILRSTRLGPRLRATLTAALLVLGPAVPSVDGPDPTPVAEDAADATPAAEPPATDPPRATDPDAGTAPPEPSSTDPAPATDPDAGTAAPEPPSTDPAPATDPGAGTPGPEQPTTDPADPAPGPTEPSQEAEPVTTVVVPAPEPVGVAGYLLPETEGFSWTVDGVAVTVLVEQGRARFVEESSEPPAAGHYLVTDVAVIAAVADPGHQVSLADGPPAAAVLVLDLRVPVELVAPSARDDAGRDDDVITVPDAVGMVVLDGAGEVLLPGEHPVTAEYVDGVATVPLTVAPGAGHRLEIDGVPLEEHPGDGATWTVTLTFTDEPAVPDPQPPADDGEFDLGEPLVLDLVTLEEDVAEATEAEEPAGERPAAPDPAAETPEDRDPAPEPEAAEPPGESDAPPAVAAAGEPSQPEAEGVDLMVVLGVVFVAGVWMVMGGGRDLFG